MQVQVPKALKIRRLQPLTLLSETPKGLQKSKPPASNVVSFFEIL